MNKTNELLQWTGAILIVAGHALNSLGSEYHHDFWNIASFTLGTALFLTWALRVKNKPQATVNIISITIMLAGLYKSLG
jgi:hypothetical protein